MNVSKAFSKFSTSVSRATGKPATFVLCVMIILVWAVSGPVFHFSDTWQLVINTGTTIITFLQVFLIQNTQNRDGAAIQAKLDELIRAGAAHNRFIGVEDLTEEELAEMRPNGAETERLRAVKNAADEAEDEANKLAAEAADKAKPSIR
jgi:low affinity Fe/Cu permease